MKISTLLTTARISEVGGTGENLLKAYADTGITEDANLQTIINLLTEKNALLITAIEKNKAYSQLEEFDQARDAAFKALYQYLEACTLLPEGITQTAALGIFPTLKKYGIGMTRLPYTEQTAQMKSLIEELAKDAITEQSSKIVHLDGMIETLKQTQTDFQQAHSDYTSQISLSKGEQSATELKSEVLQIINEKLVMYMRAMATTFPDTHAQFAQELAVEINKTNQNIKSRSNKSAENNEGNQFI